MSSGVETSAQNEKIDSLLQVLKTAKEDTNKVNALNKLGAELKQSNPDTAIILSQQALQLSEKIAPPAGGKWGAASLEKLGIYYYRKGDYPKAFDYYFRVNGPDGTVPVRFQSTSRCCCSAGVRTARRSTAVSGAATMAVSRVWKWPIQRSTVSASNRSELYSHSVARWTP